MSPKTPDVLSYEEIRDLYEDLRRGALPAEAAVVYGWDRIVTSLVMLNVLRKRESERPPRAGFVTGWKAAPIGAAAFKAALPVALQLKVPAGLAPLDALAVAMREAYAETDGQGTGNDVVVRRLGRVVVAFQLDENETKLSPRTLMTAGVPAAVEGEGGAFGAVFEGEVNHGDQAQWNRVNDLARSYVGALPAAAVDALLADFALAYGGRALAVPNLYWLPDDARESWETVEGAIREARITPHAAASIAVSLLSSDDVAFVLRNVTAATRALATEAASAVEAGVSALGKREWRAAETLLHVRVGPLAEMATTAAAALSEARVTLEGALAAARFSMTEGT